jgi:phosphotransferase system enzyme I (PtsP)
MLEALHSIMTEVNSGRDLGATLDILVRSVQKTLVTRVCSVYLLDRSIGRYVLMASQGLDPAAVGRVSLSPQEGLVGLVAQRAETVNLDNANAHPRYHYIPETREEQYESFLGVPVIHQAQVLGVLVVQQPERRRFSAEDEAFMITLSAQLAPVIALAES